MRNARDHPRSLHREVVSKLPLLMGMYVPGGGSVRVDNGLSMAIAPQSNTFTHTRAQRAPVSLTGRGDWLRRSAYFETISQEWPGRDKKEFGDLEMIFEWCRKMESCGASVQRNSAATCGVAGVGPVAPVG